VLSPFYSPRGVLTLSGAPTGGPGQQEPVLREIWRSSPRAPLRSPLDREVDVRIYNQGMVVCSHIRTVTAASVTQQRSRAVTVGAEPSVRRWYDADPLRVHCYSARLGSPITGHHHARAQRRDGTVHILRTVHGDTTRRLQIRQAYRGVSIPAPCVSGRPHLLTWARPAQLPH
jgi:hypothetical protein